MALGTATIFFQKQSRQFLPLLYNPVKYQLLYKTPCSKENAKMAE
jgi:hypothetical protein